MTYFNYRLNRKQWAPLALILGAVLAGASAHAGTPSREDLEGGWVGSWNAKGSQLEGSVRVYVSKFQGVAYVEYFLDGNPFGTACTDLESGQLEMNKGDDFNNKKIKYKGEDEGLGPMKLRTKKTRLKAKGPAACGQEGPEWKGRAKLRDDFLKGKAKMEFPDGEKRTTKFSAEREIFDF